MQLAHNSYGQHSRRACVAHAMPFQLPNASQISMRLNPLQLLPPNTQPHRPSAPPVRPEQQQTVDQQQQQQLTAVGPAHTTVQQYPSAAALRTSSSSSSITGPSLNFSKHLANLSNGCAPPPSRFESLGWLLFESKRLQASLIGADSTSVDSWLRSAEGMRLLEQVYLVGAAIADLGTADGLQPLSSSNGSRAIVSLDYSRLLERYLQQHGHLLQEHFWAGLHAYDDMQARAIHVSTALETRCMVHAMLFDKLIERVGTEGGSAAAAWAGGGAWPAQGGGAPLATAITNTMINTTQQHSAPVTSQSTVAAPSAVTSNSGNNSNVAGSSSTNTNTAGAPAVHGLWGWVGQLGAVFLLLCTVAGKVVQVVVAVVSLAKDVVLQLLMLRAVSAGAKALAAKATAAGGQGQLQPAFAVVGALPAAGASQVQQLPVQARSLAAAAPVRAAAGGVGVGSPLSAGSLGLLGSTPLPRPQPAVQQPRQGAEAMQQQGQWRVEATAGQQPTADWPREQSAAAVTDAPAQPQPVQQQQPGGPSASSGKQQPSHSARQPLRSGLAGGLGAAQQVLHKAASRAAAKVASTAATIPTLLEQQQQQQGQQQGPSKKGFRAGSGALLYSLWSPAESGLQDLTAAGAAAGAHFADAGWGAGGAGMADAAMHSAEEGGW